MVIIMLSVLIYTDIDTIEEPVHNNSVISFIHNFEQMPNLFCNVVDIAMV